MRDLIERLEAATEPSFELDEAIWCALNPDHDPTTYNGDPRWKDYTASIDAALTLVPDDLWWLIGRGQVTATEPLYGAQIRKPGFSTGGQVVSDGEHNCTAVALCIAALRARESLSQSEVLDPQKSEKR